MDFAPILFWLIWRWRPSLWLDHCVKSLFDWAASTLETDETAFWIERHEKNAAWFGGWLNVIACRIEELIAHRAAELANLDCRTEIEAWLPAHSCRSLIACHIRLQQLWERYCDVERLARLRAEKLLREAERANAFDFNTAPFAEACPHGEQRSDSCAPVEPGGRATSGLAFACTDLRARAPP